LKVWHVEIDEYHAKRNAEERIVYEINTRKEQELEDSKALFKKAQRHDKAEFITNYINEYEKIANSRDSLSATQ
jgi:hypothetical protein